MSKKTEMSKEEKAIERAIGKANLSPEEEKLARVFYKLPTAGKRTENWVRNLNPHKRDQLLASAMPKIHRTMRKRRAKK